MLFEHASLSGLTRFYGYQILKLYSAMQVLNQICVNEHATSLESIASSARDEFYASIIAPASSLVLSIRVASGRCMKYLTAAILLLRICNH